VFAWEPSQMPGIPREVTEHHLRVYPDATPVHQKPRKQSVERQNFICEEVRKLLHPEWLANPVIVPKANGKLRMCINYTSLNKTCPRDPYRLPCIDQIVDSTSGCDLLSFLDAYSRPGHGPPDPKNPDRPARKKPDPTRPEEHGGRVRAMISAR